MKAIIMIVKYFNFKLLALIIAVVILGYIVMQNKSFNDYKIDFLTWRLSNSEVAERYQLIKEISNLTTTEEALTIINKSDLPVDGELHLLTHVVGETLYKREGASSLLKCNADQLYGCTHGLLISAMTNEGFEVVKQAVIDCQKESLYQYHMCLHAAGHGFLAYTNYKLDPALAYCDEIGGDSYNLIHCYVGVFMENVHGSHDGKPAYTHPSLSISNPMAPCDTVEEKHMHACYLNQVGWWVQIFEGDYERVGRYCNMVPPKYQVECANNFGRVMSTALAGDKDKIVDYCNKMSDRLTPECISGVAASMAGLSVNDKALEFCQASKGYGSRIICYESVIEVWKAQNVIGKNNLAMCAQFPQVDQDYCRESSEND